MKPKRKAATFRILDLLAPLGDAIPAVVAVDVLEGLVAGVADAAVHLHRAVGRLAAESRYRVSASWGVSVIVDESPDEPAE